MTSYIKKLTDKGLISPPHFLDSTVQYEVIMGSIAYNVSNDASDIDVYGWCIPPRPIVFPHTAGFVPGFDNGYPKFEQYQKHHVIDKSANKEYDFTIYSIIKYFKLVMENNPNMIDSLFVPRRCVLYSTTIAEHVRTNRKLFLHKGCWHKFKGYAYAQLNKARSQTRTGKRKEVVEKYGYDLKFAYHVVRLLGEVEQILNTHDLDLERDAEVLKAIRRGEWSLEKVNGYFGQKEQQLEQVYHDSTLPYSPDKDAIRRLLLECLEQHYGTLDKCVIEQDRYVNVLSQIKSLIDGLPE